MEREVESKPVHSSSLSKELQPCKSRDLLLKNNNTSESEGALCTICFDKMVCTPLELSKLPMADLKQLKQQHHITSLERDEIEQDLWKKFKGNQQIEGTLKIVKCGHFFHEKCILEWFKNNNTCPMCRIEIK